MKNHFQNILLRNYRTILFAILLSQYTITFAQTINVSGKVTASRFPVKNVSITFIDNADTNLRYNTLTNEFGQYQIGLITSVTIRFSVEFPAILASKSKRVSLYCSPMGS